MTERSAPAKHYRATPRTPTALRVEVTHPEGASAASTRDLGPGGAFLVTDLGLPPGSRLALRIALPGSEPPLELEAEVAWATPAGAGPRGVGVRFLSPSPTALLRLQALQSAGRLPVFDLYAED